MKKAEMFIKGKARKDEAGQKIKQKTGETK